MRGYDFKPGTRVFWMGERFGTITEDFLKSCVDRRYDVFGVEIDYQGVLRTAFAHRTDLRDAEAHVCTALAQ